MARQEQQRPKRSEQGAQVRAKRSSDTAPRGEQAEPDETYAVISVLYHALQGAHTYQRYIDDAARVQDTELEEFFRQCQHDEMQRASRARNLLLDRLNEEVADEIDEGMGDPVERDD